MYRSTVIFGPSKFEVPYSRIKYDRTTGDTLSENAGGLKCNYNQTNKFDKSRSKTEIVENNNGMTFLKKKMKKMKNIRPDVYVVCVIAGPVSSV